MLLKWLFTLLAILWLYQALRPFFVMQRPHQPPSPPPEAGNRDMQKSRTDDKGEYIDYEEVE